MKITRWIIISLLGLLPLVASGQIVADSTTRVSILVTSSGTEVYELEGHAALRINGTGNDVCVNWGLFDFSAPNFVYRFVKGETDYSVGVQYTPYFIYQYQHEGRSITEIPLNLSNEQVSKVVELININLYPENRIYRYNYVKDNCATRPIAIIEKAIGDTLKMTIPAEYAGKGASFRDVMSRCHENYPWYQFGIDLSLGSGVDYELNAHEFAFAPILLPELLGSATLSNGEKLVTDPITELIPKTNKSMSEPTPWILSPMAISLIILLITLIVAWHDIKRMKVSRWLDTALFTAFGLNGCVTAFLVFISVHEATSPNWLLAWLNPFCLIAAWLTWINCCKKLVLCYHFVNFVVIIALALCWFMLGQAANVAFVPLVLADIICSARYIYINRCAIKKPA